MPIYRKINQTEVQCRHVVGKSGVQGIEHGTGISIINVMAAADLALESAEPVALSSGTYLWKPLAKKDFYEQR